MKNIILKSPANKTSSKEEAHRKLSNKSFRKEVGNASALHPKRVGNGISRLHTDRDVCKGSTDTSRNATQGCSATLSPLIGSAKPSLMATDEEGKRQELRKSGTSYPSDRRGCQLSKLSYTLVSLFYTIPYCASLIKRFYPAKRA